VMPLPARKGVGNFFANINFIPRVANNLLSLA
jgi:ABC-type transporter lipoprotein component MlaA